MKRLPYPNYVQRSGAKFETTENFLNSSVVVDSSAENLNSAGTILTQINKETNTYAVAKDEYHTFIIGETGCGKTRREILPMIRLLSKTGRSMIISDPKGELYKKTAAMVSAKGYEVYILNFRNPSKGHRWNPLGLIEQLYRNGSVESRDKAVLMLEDIADIIAQAVHSEKDTYWENAAKKVFVGIALMLVEFCQPGSLTFENISIVAKDFFTDLSKRFGSVPIGFKDYINSLPRNSPISANLFEVANQSADDTRNGIMGVFETMLSVYTNQEALLDLFASSDIDPTTLGTKPCALYFILPDDSDAMYPVATVFIKQIYSSLIMLADNNQNGVLNNRVSFILDEFANFATIPAIASMLTAARSRGITFTLVCQSMEQLQEKYKETGAETLMANCRVWIYMSCRNIQFLKRLQELVGSYISPHTGKEYPLISTSDLQHFEMGQVLVINDRCKPKLGFLPDYSEYNFGESYAEAAIPESRVGSSRIIVDSSSMIASAKTTGTKVALKRIMAQPSATVSGATPLGASLLERFAPSPMTGAASNTTETASEGQQVEDEPEMFSDIIKRIDEKIAALEAELESDDADEESDDSADDEDVEDYFDSGNNDEDNDDNDDDVFASSMKSLLQKRIAEALFSELEDDD